MGAATRVALVGLALAIVTLGSLAAPSPAFACLAARCSDPFDVWIGQSPVAVYRLDRSASRWRRGPGYGTAIEAQAAGFDDRCILLGTFTFRRVEVLRGRTPEVIVTRARTGPGDCPGWDMRGAWGVHAMRSPSGDWIVALAADAFSVSNRRAFYHLDSTGHIDNDGAFPGDYPGEGPDGGALPTTVAGWRAALQHIPDTDTASADPIDPAHRTSVLLWLAAGLGLLLGLCLPTLRRRHGSRTCAAGGADAGGFSLASGGRREAVD